MSEPYDAGEGRVIPEEMVEALEAYVNEGRPLGDFLRCVVSNDFMGAVRRADSSNSRLLKAYSIYVYMEMPSKSHGSDAAYDAWLDKFNRSPA